MEDIWRKAMFRARRLIPQKIDYRKLDGHAKKNIEKYSSQIYTFFFLDNEGKTALELLGASGRCIAFAEGCRETADSEASRYVYILCHSGFVLAVDPGQHGMFWIEGLAVPYRETPKLFPLSEQEALSAYVILSEGKPEEFLSFLTNAITEIANEYVEPK